MSLDHASDDLSGAESGARAKCAMCGRKAAVTHMLRHQKSSGCRLTHLRTLFEQLERDLGQAGWFRSRTFTHWLKKRGYQIHDVTLYVPDLGTDLLKVPFSHHPDGWEKRRAPLVAPTPPPAFAFEESVTWFQIQQRWRTERQRRLDLALSRQLQRIGEPLDEAVRISNLPPDDEERLRWEGLVALSAK